MRKISEILCCVAILCCALSACSDKQATALNTEPRINVEHALHVLEIIEAARKSQATGQRIQLVSKFPWPMVK